MSRDQRTSAEAALFRTAGWLIAGAAPALILLFVNPPAGDTPPTTPLSVFFIVHLFVLVGMGFAATLHLAPLDHDEWGFRLGPRGQRFASMATLVGLVTFITALWTLASSAALRYQPSTQFLQLLSAMDIAWVVSGTTLALRRLFGAATAVVGGTLMSLMCVWSIWRYLDEVPFAETGEWVVSGSALMRLVIPLDIAAAAITVGLVVWASVGPRRALAQPTAQRNPQSYG